MMTDRSAPTPERPTRRTALLAGGGAAAGLGTLLLAGCSAEGSSPPSSAGSSTGTQKTDPPTGSPVKAAALKDVPVGGSIVLKVGAKEVALSQPKAGVIKAFSAICTHQGCIVQAASTELDCPCHGSRFNAMTGKVLQGPAQIPLPEYTARVSGADIYVVT